MGNISFNQVSIKEQYSEEISRSNIDCSVDMGKFKMGIPVFSANMPQITEASMASCMYRNGGRGVLHRFCSIEDNVEMFKMANAKSPLGEHYCVGVSIGVQDEDKERFTSLYEAGARLFCIDVAHGHHVLVKNMIQWIKGEDLSKHDDVYLIVGNVATFEGAKDLATWGADAIKVGIGPGCFIDGTKIKTQDGLKNIEEIKDGEMVLTHRGRYKKVTGTMVRGEKEKLVKINDNIQCTKNHEMYVLHKKYKCIVTDENINEYAEWIRADELTKDYFLLQVKE